MRSVKLRIKILMVIAGVVMVSGISMMIFVKTSLYQRLFVKLQKRGISIARQIAGSSINPILTERYYELEMLARDYKNSEEDIAYIFIQDSHGGILAHTFDGGFPVELKRVNSIGAGQTYSVKTLTAGTNDLLDIAVPVLEGETGVVHLGISQDAIKRDVNEIVKFMSWLIAAIMLAGLIAAAVLSSAITKPVSRLAEAVKAVGSGELDGEVPVSSNDEIGELAGSFNSMTRELKKRTDELKRINSELTILQIISSAASGTMKLDELFTVVLNAVTNYSILRVARKGVIFMIDGDRMELVSQTGFSEAFIDAHKGLKVGTCLCGLVAEKEEIVVSGNSETDDRHTIEYPGISPHGHICIPLAARNMTLGVLCLYPPVDTSVSEREMALFYTIGSRVGAAIDNIMLYEETKELSLHDPLTGLANRRLMNYVLETEFARAQRTTYPFSAIMLDIDYFKQYNDTYGHAVGDNMLVELAGIILKEVRHIDLGVRYGGEEFLILLSETGLSAACEVAERLRKEVETKTGATISLGVSCYDHNMQKKEDIVHSADEALLRAKRNGRNRVEVCA